MSGERLYPGGMPQRELAAPRDPIDDLVESMPRWKPTRPYAPVARLLVRAIFPDEVTLVNARRCPYGRLVAWLGPAWAERCKSDPDVPVIVIRQDWQADRVKRAARELDLRLAS